MSNAKLYRVLEQIPGIDKDQALAAAETILDSNQAATKEDLQKLKSDLQGFVLGCTGFLAFLMGLIQYLAVRK